MTEPSDPSPTPPPASSPVPPAPPPPIPAEVTQVINYATAAGLPYAGPDPDANAKQWGMIAHLSALVMLVSIPSIVGPLVVWLLKKNDHPFVDDQGKEALNFHITAWIAALVLAPTVCIGIGVVLLPLLGIAVLVMSVIAGVKANEGVAYRYPYTLRLIK